MGSPISFSGFNNIDFNLILNAIMDQERQPVVALQANVFSLEGQDAQYSSLAAKLADVESAAEKLAVTTGFSARTLTKSDTSILTASSSDTAPIGAYDIVVSNLARAQVTASSSTYADSDTTVVADGGTLTIGGVAVTISGSTTLQGLADAINGTTNIPVTASVVASAPGSYQLVLTGNSTGLSNAFAITNGLTGGAGVTFGANAVGASDAALTVNNISITSAGNTIAGAIPDTTLTLLKEDPATTVTISVSRDSSAVKTLVDEFITAYNGLTDYLDEQFAASAEGNSTAIGRDGLVRGLRSSMRQTLSQAFSVGGSFSYLAEVGIGSDAADASLFDNALEDSLTDLQSLFVGGGGNNGASWTSTSRRTPRQVDLTLDASLFDNALEDSLTDLQSLFVGGGGNNGAFVDFEGVIEAYTEAGGLVPSVQARLDDQVQKLNDQIFDFEEQLAVRRASLEAEFIAADLAIAALNSQLDSLAGLGNQYRLF